MKKRTKKSSERLMFSYGANTELGAMKRRAPSATSLGAATLEGFEFEFRLHADVVEHDGCEVQGVLWSVTAADEKALDRFEGFPTYYVKRTVTVLWQGRKVRAFVYVMADGVERWRTMPSDGYVAGIRRGYAQHGVDTMQVDIALGRAKAAEVIAAAQEAGKLEQLWLDFEVAS
jgi:gamma-glutamylcyclotransferase (GGCT)/AIG2-like uncharacterized protein YtfP